MTNPTSNYNFQMPTATDLVTDLPADFEVFGQAVDTRLKALQPGTTLGDLAYSSATANTNTRLPIGTNGQVLAVVAGVPAWQNGTTGDIEGVTAGVGISGGGTSGTVTVTNSMATAMTTSGDLIQATGSGTFARLATGTNGQYLTTNGTTNSWGTITPGGMTQLASGSMSGSATIRLQSIPSTYKFCRLYIRNHIATNTNLSLRFRLNNDSTANRYSSGGETGQSISETFRYDSVYCTTDLSNTTANGMAVFEIHDYTSTGTWKMFSAMAIGNNKTTSTSVQLGSVVGAYNQTGAITEIDIFSDQGNWTGGTYTLYGVN